MRERASNLVPVLASVLHHPLQNLKEKSRNIFFSIKENGFLFPHINRFLKKKNYLGVLALFASEGGVGCRWVGILTKLLGDVREN